jgi:signal transduction histidine kinase
MASRLAADERQRRTLLADVSHELRTPLAVIQGNLEALVDGVHPADPAHIEAILDETAVLSRLVDDLRTVALSEGGTLPLHREPTDLALLAADVASSFAAAADGAGVALAVDSADDLPLLDVDPLRIREVLANLVANALRYTPRGGSIRISAAGEDRRALPAGGGFVRVAVTDTGPGIAPDVLPHVFDRFWKSADSRGSGLGLAIARNLVDAHGGQIGAESDSGGTTVWLRLPAGDAEPG